MEANPENVDAVLEALTVVDYMTGFPDTPRGAKVIATVVCKMVSNREVHHNSLGTVNDLDWLIETIASNCARFPSGPEIREMYEKYFEPQDGRD